jgi:hypothetical protein
MILKESKFISGHRRMACSCMALFFCALTVYWPVYAGEPSVTRVAIVGDSIMREVARAMERELAKQPEFSVYAFTSLRPGLSRLDLFDWLAKIEAVMKSKQPDIVVIMMGVKDRQAMRIQLKAAISSEEPDWNQDDAGNDAPAFTVIQPDAPDWNREYARRVGAAMDIMLTAGVKRIFWIELPDMRSPAIQRDCLLINSLIQKEAASRPKVVFQPSKKLLSQTPGAFSPYIYDANGMPLQIRDAEGVNLDRNGAALLAHEIISHFPETQNDTKP